VDKFARRKAAGSTDMVNDPAGAVAAGGELTEPMGDPGRPEDLPPDSELFEEFDSAVYDTSPIPPRPADEEPLAPAGVYLGACWPGAPDGSRGMTVAEDLNCRVVVTRVSNAWHAEIPKLRAQRRARTLYALDRRVRELLGPGWVDYQFRTGDPALDSLVAGVRASRRAADLAEEQARGLTGRALELAAGLSQRDLGVLLELSHQRIHQLRRAVGRGD
jgi:hypothetical protein